MRALGAFVLPGHRESIARGRKVRSGKQQQAGEEGPDHQAHRDVERAIDGVQVETREREDVEVLCSLPQDSDDDGGGQNGARGDLAVGQDPVDEEEDQDADGQRENLQSRAGERAVGDVVGVAEKEKFDVVFCTYSMSFWMIIQHHFEQ